MTLHTDDRRRSLAPMLLTLLVAVAASAVAPAPVTAHEGASVEAAGVLARVDGQVRSVQANRADASLRVGSGHEVRLVDLDGGTPATAIDFELDTTRTLRLEVLDLQGNVVRTLAHGTWAEGAHRLAWHHDADDGEVIEQGLFVVRLVPEHADPGLATAR